MQPMIEILIVEDDPRIARIHERFVQTIEGFETIGVAHSISEAKVWMEEMKPHLLLLDVYLPDDLGTNFIDYVKQNHPTTDIILVTAATEIDIVRKAYSAGISDYLVKPITLQRFEECLKQYHAKFKLLHSDEELTEEQISQLFRPQSESHVQSSPKGIDRITKSRIIQAIQDEQQGITAESLGKELGMSRSTARRYLEHLLEEKILYVEHIYGTVGRPERRYFIK